MQFSMEYYLLRIYNEERMQFSSADNILICSDSETIIEDMHASNYFAPWKPIVSVCKLLNVRFVKVTRKVVIKLIS